jgi:hypothetical protein
MVCSISPGFPIVSASPCEMTATRAPPPPEVEASDFDWIGNLGRGGLGRVTKVRHRCACEVFAVKEAINPTPDPEELRRPRCSAEPPGSPSPTWCAAMLSSSAPVVARPACSSTWTLDPCSPSSAAAGGAGFRSQRCPSWRRGA